MLYDRIHIENADAVGQIESDLNFRWALVAKRFPSYRKACWIISVFSSGEHDFLLSIWYVCFCASGRSTKVLRWETAFPSVISGCNGLQRQSSHPSSSWSVCAVCQQHARGLSLNKSCGKQQLDVASCASLLLKEACAFISVCCLSNKCMEIGHKVCRHICSMCCRSSVISVKI